LIVACAALQQAIAFRLDCHFVNNEFPAVIPGGTTCIARNVRVVTQFERVDGLVRGHTNPILAVFFRGLTLNYLPSGMDEVLLDLLVISVFNSNLLQITKNDLKPFPKLEGLWLNGNKISVIERDLFKYNPELILVSFHQNRLLHIDGNVFDSLTKMRYGYFVGNACINKQVERRSEINVLIAMFKSQCQNLVASRQHNLETGNTYDETTTLATTTLATTTLATTTTTSPCVSPNTTSVTNGNQLFITNILNQLSSCYQQLNYQITRFQNECH